MAFAIVQTETTHSTEAEVTMFALLPPNTLEQWQATWRILSEEHDPRALAPHAAALGMLATSLETSKAGNKIFKNDPVPLSSMLGERFDAIRETQVDPARRFEHPLVRLSPKDRVRLGELSTTLQLHPSHTLGLAYGHFVDAVRREPKWTTRFAEEVSPSLQSETASLVAPIDGVVGVGEVAMQALASRKLWVA